MVFATAHNGGKTQINFNASGRLMCGPIGGGNGQASSYIWSVWEDLYQTPDPPMGVAIINFNNRRKRKRITFSA